MATTLNPNLLLAIPLAPLAGSAIAGLFGTKFFGEKIGRKMSHSVTILGVAIAFILSVSVLLDVIMETDAAGLDLVEYIRNEIKNETVRIILRTGQPGQAPERRVIVEYDINDYKAKTELTADKLFTSLTAALRSYQQLERMVQTRRGLEIIIDAASTLYDFKSMQRLAEGVLTQLASLLNVDCAGILVLRDAGDDVRGNFISYNARTENFSVQSSKEQQASGDSRVRAVIMPRKRDDAAAPQAPARP